MLRSTFISHAHGDNVICAQYADALRAIGIDLWIDLTNAQKGYDISNDITQQLERCSAFLLMVTEASNNSRWVSSELSNYYSLYNDKESYIVDGVERMILPVRLENVPIPIKVRGFNWIDAVGKSFGQIVDEIASALGAVHDEASSSRSVHDWEPIPIPSRLARLDFKGWRIRKTGVDFILPPICQVPGGTFVMGSDKRVDPLASDDEVPQYNIPVETFYMGSYPVTVAEYSYAVNAGAVRNPQVGYAGTTWAKQQEHPDHPVTCVSWLDAMAYAMWLGNVCRQNWRLPSEAEWEKAARWDTEATSPYSRIYPWGNHWDKIRANTSDGGPAMTTPVGFYADKGDASPFGVHDMAGNVWEWTSSIWQESPPYDSDISENLDDTSSRRVFRGGSWGRAPRFARAASRSKDNPDDFGDRGGVRLALDVAGMNGNFRAGGS